VLRRELGGKLRRVARLDDCATGDDTHEDQSSKESPNRLPFHARPPDGDECLRLFRPRFRANVPAGRAGVPSSETGRRVAPLCLYCFFLSPPSPAPSFFNSPGSVCWQLPGKRNPRRRPTFAIDHAATALLVKRRYPSVPLAPILISVQAMELAWVALNYLGVERTTTEPAVRSVADIHLAYMPWSHSVATPLLASLAAWLLIEKGFRRAALGRAVALGILSHLILDLLTHAPDIQLWPGLASPRLGLGLYASAPLAAFVVEFLYGIFCWRVDRGGRALLAVIVLFNLANLSFFSPAIPGPEQYLAGRPLLVVTLVFAQIIVTLVLVGIFARRPSFQPSGR
jgi:membrane-bound metal-dependent hydrolase YbcI (DUF457 family)